MYSPGKLLVVYVMRKHDLPTPPSPVRTTLTFCMTAGYKEWQENMFLIQENVLDLFHFAG